MRTTRIKAIVDLADVEDEDIHCVRCGHLVTDNHYIGLLSVVEDSEKFGHADMSRTCSDCGRSFVRWFLDGAVSGLIASMPQELRAEYDELMRRTK